MNIKISLPTNTPPAVFLVDDDLMLRDALSSYLSLEGQSVKCFGSACEFLAFYDGRQPGCLVTDMRMPDMSGLELQQELGAMGLKIPIIFITGYADVNMCIQAFEAGAAGFLQKPFDCAQLLELTREAITRDLKRYTIEREIAMIKHRFARLTPRERDVMLHVAKGESSKVIAKQLGVSPRTVEVHRASIYEKVRSRSVVELAHMVSVCGLVRQPTGEYLSAVI